MEQYTKKQIDNLVENAATKYISPRHNWPSESLDLIDISKGKHGLARLLFIGIQSRKLYAVTDESIASTYWQ